MIKSRKKGVTLSSLVIYIVLFTSFTIFVTNISSNMNERLLDNRGEAINYSSLNKLQYNIDDSALNSTDVTVTSNSITYSNGDVYTYDSANKIILKNNGVLCQNVQSFVTSVGTNEDVKRVTIVVGFNKYLNTMTKTIISCVEVM